MHQRISTTLNTLRQDLAAKLGGASSTRLAAGRATHGPIAAS